MAVFLNRLASLFRRSPAALPEPGRAPFGWSGTKIQGGRIRGEDPNPNLQGKDWAEKAMEMLRTDTACAASWEAVSSTLLSPDWRWESGTSDDPFAEFLAKTANEMMGMGGRGAGRMRRSWEEMLGQMVLHEWIGFRYAEPIFRFRRGHGFDLVDIEDRDPRVHRAWVMNRGRLVGVTQDPAQEDRARGVSRIREIPAEGLLLLVREGTGNNFEGRGLGRAAYFPWHAKQATLDAISVAVDRWAFATPKITVLHEEARAAGVVDGTLQAQVDAAETVLGNYLARAGSWLVESEFVKFEQYGGGLDAGPVLDVARYYDIEILRASLVQFLAVGISDAGAKNAGEVHENFFRRNTVNALDRIAAAMSGPHRRGGGVIGRWVEANYGPHDPSVLPRLTHTGLSVDYLKQLIPSLAPLTAAGWFSPTTDPAARAALRDAANFPAEQVPDD